MRLTLPVAEDDTLTLESKIIFEFLVKLTTKNLTKHQLANVNTNAIERIADGYVQQYRMAAFENRDTLLHSFIKHAHNGKDDSALESAQFGSLKQKLASAVASARFSAPVLAAAKSAAPSSVSVSLVRSSAISHSSQPASRASVDKATSVKPAETPRANAGSSSSASKQINPRVGSTGSGLSTAATANSMHMPDTGSVTARHSTATTSASTLKPSTGRLGADLSGPDATVLVSTTVSAAGGRKVAVAPASSATMSLVEEASSSLRSDMSNQQHSPAETSPPTSPSGLADEIPRPQSASAPLLRRESSSRSTAPTASLDEDSQIQSSPQAKSSAVLVPTSAAASLPRTFSGGRSKRVLDSPDSNSADSPAKTAKMRHRAATTPPSPREPTTVEVSITDRNRHGGSSTTSSPAPELPAHPLPAAVQYGSTGAGRRVATATTVRASSAATGHASDGEGECEFV